MATRKQEIKIRNKFGWKLYKDSNIQLWFSGYLVGEKNVEDILVTYSIDNPKL